jgi:hypothetical protein
MVTHEQAIEGALAALEGVPMDGQEAKHLMGCRYCQEVELPGAFRLWQAMNIVLMPRLMPAHKEEMERRVIEKLRDLDARRPRGWRATLASGGSSCPAS